MSGASWISGQPRERQASAPTSTASARTTSAWSARPHVMGRALAALLAELLIEDLADEAVDRNRIEAHVRGRDHPGVDDLTLRELLEHALEVAAGVALLAPDPELFALERDARGVAEAEHTRDQALVHQLGLVEHLAVGRAAAGTDDEPGRDLDAATHLHRPARLVVLRSHQDVGQHVIARDDPGERLAHHLRLVEDVAQEL